MGREGLTRRDAIAAYVTPGSWYVELDRLIVGEAGALGACMRGGRLLLVRLFFYRNEHPAACFGCAEVLALGVMRYLAYF